MGFTCGPFNYFLGYLNIMILLREYVKQVSVKSDEAIDRSTVVIWGNASRSYLPSEPTFLLSSTVRKETKIVAEASHFEF